MTRDIIKSFIRNADPEKSAKRSFRNFHARGATYVNLAFSEDVVVKLYFFNPEEMLLIPDSQYYGEGIVVNPHNHLYDFETFVVAGRVSNLIYARTTSEKVPVRYEHKYCSFLRGSNKVSEYGGPCRLKLDEVENMVAGEHYSMTNDVIHSISVPMGQETILFLIQHRDRPVDYTSLFTPTVHLPSLGGLYSELSSEEIGSLLQHVERVL